jgi:hypothetical protein
MRSRPATLLIPAQVTAAIFGLVLMAMWPPASGAMLLVPVGRGDVNAGARIALASGATLLGVGPFPGSLVVVGDRARIAGQRGASGFVLLAAPPAGCGAHAAARATA